MSRLKLLHIAAVALVTSVLFAGAAWAERVETDIDDDFSAAGFNLPNHGASGCPSTGSYEAGTVVVGSDGVWCYCTASGSPGTWVNVANLGTDATAIHDDTSGEIAAVAAKASPVAADLVLLEDSEASNAKKAAQLGNIAIAGDVTGTLASSSVSDGADSTAVHDDTSGEIAAVTAKASPVAADLVLLEDSAASNAKKSAQLGNVPIAGDVTGTLAATTVVGGDVDTAAQADASWRSTVTARKSTAGTITALKPVYVVGWNSSPALVTVEEADNTDPAKVPAIGLTPSNITDSSSAEVVMSGLLDQVNTSAYTAGDLLYVGAAGALVNSPPTGGAHVQPIAVVARSNAANGRVVVLGGGGDVTSLHSDVAGELAALTAKGSPTTSDVLLIEDAAASNAKKKITIGDLPASTPDKTVFHLTGTAAGGSWTVTGTTSVGTWVLSTADAAAYSTVRVTVLAKGTSDTDTFGVDFDRVQIEGESSGDGASEKYVSWSGATYNTTDLNLLVSTFDITDLTASAQYDMDLVKTAGAGNPEFRFVRIELVP